MRLPSPDWQVPIDESWQYAETNVGNPPPMLCPIHLRRISYARKYRQRLFAVAWIVASIVNLFVILCL